MYFTVFSLEVFSLKYLNLHFCDRQSNKLVDNKKSSFTEGQLKGIKCYLLSCWTRFHLSRFINSLFLSSCHQFVDYSARVMNDTQGYIWSFKYINFCNLCLNLRITFAIHVWIYVWGLHNPWQSREAVNASYGSNLLVKFLFALVFI